MIVRIRTRVLQCVQCAQVAGEECAQEMERYLFVFSENRLLGRKIQTVAGTGMSGRSTFVVLVSQGEEYSRRGGVAVDTVTKALVEALGAGGGAKTPRSKGRFEFIGAE